MKKQLLVLGFGLVILLTAFSCTQPSSDFVYIEKNKFMWKEKEHFALMINYLACIRMLGDGQLSPSPALDYDSLDVFEAANKSESIERINAHFHLIKELGFNTIRLAGLDFLEYDSLSEKLKFKVIHDDGSSSLVDLEENKGPFLEVFRSFVEIAKTSELQLMILLPRPLSNNNARLQQESFIINVLSEFRDIPSVFAYDFFNEPLYFDKSELKETTRDKKEAFLLSKEWRRLMNDYAPNQLFTIGLSEPIEVFEWDPSILELDFIAFHTYQPLRVPNEIYWYHKYSGKPWMLGETSLPVDNKTVSYLEQGQFMKEAYQRVIDCGGIGFGWWHFQDLTWGTSFEHEFTALLDHSGITYTEDSAHVIYGALKPAAYEVANLDNYSSDCRCDIADNYFNMLGYNNLKISGKVLDCENQKPVEGALIRGWTADWAIAANTYTHPDGSFDLYSNKEFVHFQISAPGMTSIRIYKELDYSRSTDEEYEIDSLPNSELEYHKVDYHPLLKNPEFYSDSNQASANQIFDFKPDQFNQYKFETSFGNACLEKLDIEDWD